MKSSVGILFSLSVLSFQLKLTRTAAAVVSSLDDLGFDENGKLSSYHVVYPAHEHEDEHEDEHDGNGGNGNCAAMVSKLGGSGGSYGVIKTALTGEALDTVFPNWSSSTDTNTDAGKERCEAALLERGTDRSMVGYPMPYKRWSSDNDNDNDDVNVVDINNDLTAWYQGEGISVEICLMNYLDQHHPLKVYWVSVSTQTPDRQYIHTLTLEYGERNTRCFNTFLGHQFVVKDHQENIIPVPEATFTVEYPLILGFGEAQQHDIPLAANHFDKTIEDTLRTEWQRHNVPQRTFSPLGFAKGRLPNDVFGSMGAFFYNNRLNKYREEWGGKGVFVNWWQSDVFMMQIPWNLKGIWQIRLADLVSEWVGMPCEQTVMYGLRQYESGARLLTHVDRLSTHVVSLIVNVAQGGLEQDWPVEVFDHAGRLHEVVMEAGDIVYYESAKNLHSRNRPLMGKDAFYVNLFTHYRPVEMDENWHNLPTPDAKKPILEVDLEESCTIPPKVMGKETEYLGYGKVRCKDPRLGKNLSPSLFVAKEAGDLVQWWRRTAPEGGYHDDGGEGDAHEEVGIQIDGNVGERGPHDGDYDHDDDDDYYQEEDDDELDDELDDDDDDSYYNHAEDGKDHSEL